jgi:hypothetical protein
MTDYDKIVRDIRGFLPQDPPHSGRFDIMELPRREFYPRAAMYGAEFSRAYYHPTYREAAFQKPVEPETVVHELTHAVMDVDWAIYRPEWFCEGFAEMMVHVLCRGRFPRHVRKPPAVVGAPRALLYGMDFETNYHALAGHVAWLAWNEGMRPLLQRFSAAKGGLGGR